MVSLDSSQPFAVNYRIICGDSLSVLRQQPSESARVCVTGPSYFNMAGRRAQQHAQELGFETTPDEYIRNLVAIFREVRRVLTDDGALWLVLGDRYADADGYRFNATDTSIALGIPWRLALALVADGWLLRQDYVWHRINAASAAGRAKVHDYVFHLSKNIHARCEMHRHTVWPIPQCYDEQPFSIAFPMPLAQACIEATTAPGDVVLDPFCGAGTTGHASLMSGRRFLGIDIDPDCIAVSVARCEAIAPLKNVV